MALSAMSSYYLAKQARDCAEALQRVIVAMRVDGGATEEDLRLASDAHIATVKLYENFVYRKEKTK